MTKFWRLLTIAAVTTTTCVGATQAGGLASASVTPTSPDGGPSGALTVNADHSQTPPQVRDHSARLLGHLSGAQHVRVTLGVKPRDVAGAETFNRAVQDPHSPLFHQYLTAAQWNARFAPTAAEEQAVVDWAKVNHLTVTHRFPNRML